MVFYNGTDPLPEYSTLKLSSAYRNKEEAPQLELQVQIININLGFNAELMDACQILKEYAQFVAEVREQAKVYPNRQAIVQAVDVCIKKDILKEFLLENKKEVIDMVFFEYDAEAEKRVIYKDGKEDGKEEGKAEEIRKDAVAIFKALDCSGLSRVDFFLTKDTNEVVFNEINTLPGFTSISMFPMLWKDKGYSIESLVETLIEMAKERP